MNDDSLTDNILYVEDTEDAPYVKAKGESLLNVIRMIDSTNNDFSGNEMKILLNGRYTALYDWELSMLIEDIDRAGIDYVVVKKDSDDEVWKRW